VEPRAILPGVVHWTAVHPKIRVGVSSYWIAHARVLLDPLLPPGGLDWLAEVGPPEHVVLTNRHHWRHCSEITGRFGCPVWCNELGLPELDGEPGRERVRGFRTGDALPGGIESYDVGVLCPDETALRFELPAGAACLAVADGVVRIGEAARGEGPLAFVPDFLIAQEPARVEAVKRGLRRAYRGLCDLEWDTLLLAHGHPFVGDGREKLRAFVGG
jgi:hypothetical protein